MTIQKSEQLNELFSALSKLQGKIDHVKKDKAGYKNRYKYADLTQYIDLSQELLAEYGLCILQMPGSIEIMEVTREIIDEKGNSITFHIIKIPKQKVTTFVGHISGQYISSSMEILIEKVAGNSWGQSTGSSISYARKYSRAGSLGMSQEDDDNEVQKKEENNKYQNGNGKSNSISLPSRQILEEISTAKKLSELIKSSGFNVAEFATFHNIVSSDLPSVKKAIDNFDKLSNIFKEHQIKKINNDEVPFIND